MRCAPGPVSLSLSPPLTSPSGPSRYVVYFLQNLWVINSIWFVLWTFIKPQFIWPPVLHLTNVNIVITTCVMICNSSLLIYSFHFQEKSGHHSSSISSLCWCFFKDNFKFLWVFLEKFHFTSSFLTFLSWSCSIAWHSNECFFHDSGLQLSPNF